MSLLKSLNRHMERNQAARMALLGYFDKASIEDMDDFSDALWASINESNNQDYLLEVFNNDEVSFEFLIKLLIKIGFSSDHAAKLMMNMHKHGSINLAMAEEGILSDLEKYINAQAKKHGLTLLSNIRKT